MSNAKHTPGPWSLYDDSNDGKTNRIEIVAIGKTIAHIYNSVQEEDLPNARLIAASPRMATALQRAAHILAEIDQATAPAVLALRSEIVACINEATPEHYAIAKAKGEA